jgi:hypothetical protein
MDIIKTFFILLTTLSLIACGGENSDTAEIIFPEHLPKVNPKLQQESPAGIWMSYRVHNTKIRNLDGEQNIKGEVTEVAHEMTVIDHDEHGIYTLQFCTTTEFQERYSQGFDILKNGYSYIYSGYENGPDTGSTGRINVTYLSNQKMYGLGHKRTPYVSEGQEIVEEETIEFFAVKISDEVNFNDSDDLIYTSDVKSQAGKEPDLNPICLGTYERKIKVHTDNIVTYENHDKHLMLADHNAWGFDLYTAEGGDFGIIDQKLVGGWYDRQSIESQCDITDEECLNRHTLELNILKNDNSGMVFSARLGSDDGDFLDIKISAIINPFDPIPETQE